ncbi:MAG: transglycosylase SLT domain-containing protein [Candidatus Solibacter usitatus]|nr:transglycosylase SLT domain-containing protein [Candidatus Solibacter usitatus]
MTTRRYSDRITLAPWRNAAAVFALLLQPAAAQPAPARDDALLRLKAGVEALERGDAAAALRYLSSSSAGAPLIADYTAWWTAQAHALLKNHPAVAPALEPVWRSPLPSPLAGRAAILAARSLIEVESFQKALDTLARVPQDQLPEPQGQLLLAQASESLGDPLSAATHFQAVYYGFPLSEEARQARAALDRLERQVGDRFPPAMPQSRLDRAQKLLDAKQAARAREEYQEMAPLLGGLEREQARVRIAAADYQARKTDGAIAWLRSLQLAEPEAEAERLFWLASCYRRLDRDDEMLAAVAEAGRRAPGSPWRLKALVMAANSLMVRNDWQRYTPLFQACAADFPTSEDAPLCHWKALWRTYLNRRPESPSLLRDHLIRFPASDKAGTAVYYLGRLAERTGDAASARRYFLELQTRFPNYYYTLLARELLNRPELARAPAAPETDRFLASIAWPGRARQADAAADPVTLRRLDRARLLSRAGLESWAETELRFGARNGGKPFPLAVELSETAIRRGDHAMALRYIKGTVPVYLWLNRDGASMRFWKLAFPFPFRARIERFARERGLDPFLIAALIRQESEFDPKVVSYAGAIGLMQVMPPTGRELGRRLGLGRITAARLKDPDTNLNIGTYYFKRQLDARDGSVEDTLAGYNAGPTRIPSWHGWADTLEPSEFVETIPFAQTRDYVQIILRNADFYRWIYGSEPSPAVEPAVQPKRASAKPAPAKQTRSNVRRRK